MAKKRKSAKKPRKGAKSSSGIGKVTFVYFSGDVGEFLNALSSKLKEPGVAESLAQGLAAVAATVEQSKKSGFTMDGDNDPN